MRRQLRNVLTLALAAVILAGLFLPAYAAEETTTAAEQTDGSFKSIHTPEDLQAMAEDPTGHYVLAEDLDMAGFEWKPVDFSGVFDGAGYSILNLQLTQVGDTKAEVYDGNRKGYEASFAGLFGTLTNAQVYNLNLINVRSVLDVDVPCFMGGLAGYCLDSTVTSCRVTGTLELRAYNQMFGLGGLIGYGRGTVSNCDLEVTLVCVDTDSETKDEQFLGGVYATGFIDVTGTKVDIQGFVSEHGYSHNGGITGLFMQYPLGAGKTGRLTDNVVKGKIKFFEDNLDRRAYCAAFAGEMLLSGYVFYNNLQYFQREEVWTYDEELRPCMCEDPVYDEYTVYPLCSKHRYGHFFRQCYGCGYIDKSDFKLLTHSVSNWEVVEAATLESEGSSVGTCDECGAQQSRIDPVLEPEKPEWQPIPTVGTIPVQTQQAASEEMVQGKISILFYVLAAATILLIAATAYVAYDLRKKRK